MPFGAGPRACIGMQIAMLEIPIVIAAVLQSFMLETPLTSVPLHAAITVLPSAALPLRPAPALNAIEEADRGGILRIAPERLHRDSDSRSNRHAQLQLGGDCENSFDRPG